MPAAFRIRPAVQADGGFLADMVVEAANWRQGGSRPRHQILASEEYRDALKAPGYFTRDARKKERKKYGRKGARARFQFSKR